LPAPSPRRPPETCGPSRSGCCWPPPWSACCPSDATAPLIDGCVAWLECRPHARHEAGDHVIFIGEVVTVERARGAGLIFHQGRFASARSLPDPAGP
jgi:flavin reductase (DIM6/NTAB) family NADH-FMN oxidoreductase RutF